MKPYWIFKGLIIFAIILRIEGSISLGVTGLGMATAALYAGFDKIRCSFYECCSSNAKWIKPNMTGKL